MNTHTDKFTKTIYKGFDAAFPTLIMLLGIPMLALVGVPLYAYNKLTNKDFSFN